MLPLLESYSPAALWHTVAAAPQEFVRVTGDVKVLPKVDVVNSTGAAGGGPKMFFGAKNARASSASDA